MNFTRPEWDTRVVWLPQRGSWWWNAWHKSTTTELWGFAGSQEQAMQDMVAAIRVQRSVWQVSSPC